MTGVSWGCPLGYALAALALGACAPAGWDRNIAWMAAAMRLGNLLIYTPGLLWLNPFTSGWAQTLDWDLWPFLLGDAIKLAAAALLLPALWTRGGRQPRLSTALILQRPRAGHLGAGGTVCGRW